MRWQLLCCTLFVRACPMTLFDLLLLALAGFAAGGMNALAGGGTFSTICSWM